MLVPLSWMEEYVPGSVPNEEDVAERMILSGSNIETVKKIGNDGIEGIVVGRLAEVFPHPDSDHLLVCKVDVGAGAGAGEAKLLQIVTGAPNVKEGDYVPVALHGATLPGGVRIKRGKLRGEASEGMLCSAQELGFEDKVVPLAHKDGIWILPEELRDARCLGQDALDALGLSGSTVIDFEITPNRPDCLSIYGMSREYAAVYDLPLEAPEILGRDAAAAAGFAGYPEGKSAEELVKVRVARPDLCTRYIARVAENVVVKESPWWMQRKLMLSGMRPINNIVDITNYVMLELGHPIHAFDIREIKGGEIRVDTAAEGEKFTTLDGTERMLRADTLLIKDGARGVAIAGVMGGLDSGIREDTDTILIESASFSMDSIRLTSRRLGLRTEASSRYEKGVPADLSQIASDRVCRLIAQTGSGTVLAGAADCYPVPQEPVRIQARVSRVNAILGTGLSPAEMAALLRRLQIEVEISDISEAVLTVRPPTARIDLKEEIDIVEEVARIYGYDRLESTIHADRVEAASSKSWNVRRALRDVLTGCGISEIQTYSFVPPEGVDRIGAGAKPEATDFVRLINPLGEENSVMRTLLLPGMLDVLARNFNRGNAECAAFEIGNTFHSLGKGEQPKEALSLCVATYSRAGQPALFRSGQESDFYRLKGVLERIFAKLGLRAPLLAAEANDAVWHPGRCAKVYLPAAPVPGADPDAAPGPAKQNAAAAAQGGPQELFLGMIGEIHPDVLARFGIEERVCACELNFDALAPFAVFGREYAPLPKYPAALRDVALLVPEDVPVGRIEGIVREKAGRNLESAALFDVYRGKQVPDGQKSLAFNLTFRAADRTLTDEEIAKALDKTLKALESEAGAVLRDA